MVVHPFGSRRQRGGGDRLIALAIHEEVDARGRPLNGIDMIIVGEPPGRNPEGLTDALGAGIARAVDGAMDGIRLAADVLHDVDLAAGGPWLALDVGAEHPVGRPDALPVGNPDARLHAPIFEGELALRLQAGGGEFAGRGLQRPNHQMALAIQIGIAAVVGVDFQLMVAPSVAAEIVYPLRGIGRGAWGPVEVVTPDQVAILGDGGGDGKQQTGQEACPTEIYHRGSGVTVISCSPEVRQNAQITMARTSAG